MNWLQRLFAACALIMLASVSFAQSDGPDYVLWQKEAANIETLIEAGRAADQTLETLREKTVSWREVFVAAQSTNKTRITSVQEQIAALGPVPEDGTEDPVADRRSELQAQLLVLKAPVLRAEEAFTRSVAIISGIDELLRKRQASELFKQGPLPILPATWALAYQDITRWLADGVNGIDGFVYWGTDRADTNLAGRILGALVLGVLGGSLLLLGLRGFKAPQLSGESYGRGYRAIRNGIGEVIPYFMSLIGISLLSIALVNTGILGTRGAAIVQNVPLWGAWILGARWLGVQSAHLGKSWTTNFLNLITWLGVSLVVWKIVGFLDETEFFTSATKAVLTLPTIIFASILLIRISQLIRAAVAKEVEAKQTDVSPLSLRIASQVGQVTRFIGYVAPVMAAIGYTNAAEFLTFAFVQSLFILILIVVLQRLLTTTYCILLNRENASETLFSVLIGFALTVLALPVFALVWGTRVTSLTELWTRFQDGFEVGNSRISPTDFLTFVVIFVIGYTATRLVQTALRSSVLPKTQIDVGAQNAIVSGLGYVGIFLAALIAISSAGLDLSSLAIVAGALSVGIGFGLQNIVSNFVSGIILLIERPVTEGDWIEVGGQMGYVRNISVRSTRIETFDRTDVIIPNSDLVSGVVTNWTRGNTVGRLIVPVGVAYGNDTRKVQSILLEIAQNHPMVLLDPAPSVAFQGFGADSMDFEIRVILRDINWMLSVKTDINHSIAERFAEEGIEIPFAQRDIWIRNPEALNGGKNDTA